MQSADFDSGIENMEVDETDSSKDKQQPVENADDVILQLVSRIFRVRLTDVTSSDDALHLPELSHSLSQHVHQPCMYGSLATSSEHRMSMTSQFLAGYSSTNDLICQVVLEALLMLNTTSSETSTAGR